jgi:hypothetical protein
MGLVVGTSMSTGQMAAEVARVAAGKQHRLAAYLVDGSHPINPAQYEGIMRHLSGCRDLPGSRVTEENMGRARAGAEAEAACSRDHVADITAGFYATPSRTGNNDLDFWKVTEGRKPGVRFAKRVIGGGDTKYPRLVEISQQEQRTALGAILRAGIPESANMYADNQERCMKCGIHLTDDESRAARMGPVCRGDR